MTTNLKFETIIPTQKQIDDLYKLLSERKYFISHNILPTKKEHQEFVSNNPYLAWYLIRKSKDLIGSVYVHHDNSIGININNAVKENITDIILYIKSKHKPLSAVKSQRRGEFFINISSDNEELLTTLKEIGAKEIQRSFIV
jgi:hypothetical protein